VAGKESQLSKHGIQLLGLLAGSLTTFSFLPQLARVYRRKSAADLSYGYLAVFALGISLWLIYGLLLRDVPIILANVVTLSLVITLILMKFAYAFARR
jgi:MtN3 and saliva related transmembrane protein